MIEIFDQARLNKAKRAFTTRRVPVQDMRALETGPVAPVAGDLVLARVESVGRLQRLELTTGRKAAATGMHRTPMKPRSRMICLIATWRPAAELPLWS
jgi:hypothetical protein